MAHSPSWLSRRLASAPIAVFSGYAIAAAFATYFCMYAFRRPWAAASFKGMDFVGTEITLKTAFVISQIVGYTSSKYIGIKVCSEAGRQRRGLIMIGLILVAELALLFFGLLPPNWKVLAIFLNGLPLGMIWGLVVSYLEGRRTSELLLAGLSCSYIISSAAVKDVGRYLMMPPDGGGTSILVAAVGNAGISSGQSWGSAAMALLAQQRIQAGGGWGISEAWMPFTTGLLFLIPFILSVWMLEQVPPPDGEDVVERVERTPMYYRERLGFLRLLLPGLILLFIMYFFLTAFRDFRDLYGKEIFDGLGYQGTPAIFSRTDLPVAFGVMVALALLNLIHNNRLALVATHLLMVAGFALIGIATMLFDANMVTGQGWMILVGLGAYLAYVPHGSVLFDRMIASTRIVGTAVFAIYVADAIGYTGSVVLQLFKDLVQTEMNRLEFFHGFTYIMSLMGVVLTLGSCIYFLNRSIQGDKVMSGGVSPRER